MKMKRILVKELLQHKGEEVCIKGWVHRIRELGSIAFVLLRERTGMAQIVLTKMQIRKLTPESVIEVIGKVRVLLSSRDHGKMKKGEILVAPMTSPDYILAMRKAKAIITDVGGLMSHAAIVSRELGVPAVVGTKVATKVLKDGDRVEVDAKNGIVRKLTS